MEHSSPPAPQIELLIVCDNHQVKKNKMEQLCLIPQIYYEPSGFPQHLLSLFPFTNSYYLMLCPPSSIQNHQESSLTPEESQPVLISQPRDLCPDSCSPSSSRPSKKQVKNTNTRILLKKEVDQQFQMAVSNKKKGIMYKKKNTESNIVNQVLSFINCERSSPFLIKILGGEDRARAFSRILGAIKRANRKYTNRKYLKRLMEFGQRSEFHRIYLKQKQEKPSMEEMRMTIRKLILYFLRHYSMLSLMTSAKIYKETLGEHFWRKREIKEFLFGGKEGAEDEKLMQDV